MSAASPTAKAPACLQEASPTAEAPVCLRAEVVDNNDGGPKDSATTTEAPSEDKGYVTRPRDLRQRRRRQVLDDRLKESTTTREALWKKDEQEDYNHDNGCVSGR